MPFSGRNLGDAINAALDAVPAPADTLPATLAAFRLAYYRALGIEIVDGCAGDFVTEVDSILSPYAPITTDQVLACDTTGGAITITLPAAGGIFWITLLAGAWPVTVGALGVVSHVGETLTVVYADGAWRILQRTLANADANNADTLDGLHAMAFAGAAHVHDASEVTSGTLPLARGGTGRTTCPAGQIVYGNAAGTAQTSDTTLVRDAAAARVGIGATAVQLARSLHVRGDTSSGSELLLPIIMVENVHVPTAAPGDFSFSAFEMQAGTIAGGAGGLIGRFFADGKGYYGGAAGACLAFLTWTPHPIFFAPNQVTAGGFTTLGRWIIGGVVAEAVSQIGVKDASGVYNYPTRHKIHGLVPQSTVFESLIRLVRPVSGGNYYPGSCDFKLGAYAASTGAPFSPKTELEIWLKNQGTTGAPDQGWYEGAETKVMNLRADGLVGVPGGLYGGEQIVTVTAAASPYTPLATDRTINCDCTAGAVQINLPAVASSAKRVFYIKKIDTTANVVTIEGSGAELVDLALNQTLVTALEALRVHCDGAAWWCY